MSEARGTDHREGEGSGSAEEPEDVKLTELQMIDLANVFKLFDSDNSGTIDITELGNAMATLGHKPTEEELVEYMEAMDKDGSGDVNFNEFATFMGPRMFNPLDADVEQLMIQAFAVLDADNSGTVSANEIFDLMKSLGNPITMDEADAMIHEADLDGSGNISYVELVSMIGNVDKSTLDNMPTAAKGDRVPVKS